MSRVAVVLNSTPSPSPHSRWRPQRSKRKPPLRVRSSKPPSPQSLHKRKESQRQRVLPQLIVSFMEPTRASNPLFPLSSSARPNLVPPASQCQIQTEARFRKTRVARGRVGSMDESRRLGWNRGWEVIVVFGNWACRKGLIWGGAADGLADDGWTD